MRVDQVMTKGVVCALPTDALAWTAERMRELDIGSLPVCGDNDKLVGMITDRDITVRATAGGCDPLATRVAHVMTPEVICCFEDQEVEEAAHLMEEKQIRRLPVLDRHRRLVGILSLGDVAVKTRDHELSGETLEEVSMSEPALPAR